MDTMRRPTFGRWVPAAAALALGACGGGGGGAPAPDPAPVPDPPPAPTVSRESLEEASRFASSATFGLAYGDIEAIARDGREDWLDGQLAMSAGTHTPIVDDILRRREAGEFDEFEEDLEYLILARRLAWWHRTITSPDVLRQRVAFALSEIFVVSDNVDTLIVAPYALSTYYDVLLTHCFGNFRDLLREVSLHPAMGFYLSHVNNRKADPAANTFPDENYAREVMQLFSIGLFELNPDGTLVLDERGEPVPTYTNEDIREFARVFTGLSYAGPGAFFGREAPYFRAPMRMFDAAHDSGSKTLLRGTVLPAGQTGMQDIEAAIDNLFHHPNVGPFIGRLLIQRLVTSNPSPAYVERVTRAFDGETTGVRGDMRAVLRAILLDPQAGAAVSAASGKLREPVVRYASILRQFGARSDDGFIANTGYILQELTRQHPLSAPSVFNFFLPAHAPAGEIAGAGLVAPEFQITTATTVVGITNLIDYVVVGDFAADAPPPFSPVTLDLGDYEELAGDVDALLDRLDIVLTAGTVAPATRSAIARAVEDIADESFRLRTAIYLFLISPDYAVRL